MQEIDSRAIATAILAAKKIPKFRLQIILEGDYLVEAMRGHHYDKPLQAMRTYLDVLEAALLRRGMQRPGDLGGRRGVVDKHRARLHACERPVGPERYATQVRVIADATEHDVGAGHGLARGWGMVLAADHCKFSTPCY